jgi:hypothetical protein
LLIRFGDDHNVLIIVGLDNVFVVGKRWLHVVPCWGGGVVAKYVATAPYVDNQCIRADILIPPPHNKVPQAFPDSFHRQLIMDIFLKELSSFIIMSEWILKAIRLKEKSPHDRLKAIIISLVQEIVVFSFDQLVVRNGKPGLSLLSDIDGPRQLSQMIAQIPHPVRNRNQVSFLA